MAALNPTIDEALKKLYEKAPAWKDMPKEKKAELARKCRAQFATADWTWQEDNLRCLGIEPSLRDSYNSLGMENFLFLKVVADRLDKIAEKLEGKLTPGEAVKEVDGVKVYATGELDPNATPGCKQEVWSVPGTDEKLSKQEGGSAGEGVCIVLGAGNKTFLTVVDCVERQFLHNEVVFLKNHPIRPFLKEPLEHLLKPLIDEGVFAQCVDADVGTAHAELIGHESVRHLHMTGSGATHGRLVETLEKVGRVDKVTLTSELGCVTPWIVCPGIKNEGKWTKEEIEHQAGMLARAYKDNCSANCCAPKAVVLPSEELWPQKTQFLEALDKAIERLPQFPAYYPGAHTRWNNFAKEYPEAKKIASKGVQEKPIEKATYTGQNFEPLASLLVDCGTFGKDDFKDFALVNEAFAPALAFVTVDSKSREEFPLEAAKFSNEKIFGSLSVTLIYPDERDALLDKTIAALNYGNVGVNIWTALTYSECNLVWGGAPGTWELKEPDSGLGFVGNALGVPDAAKGVALGPFMNTPLSKEKPIPMIVLDSLMILISGQNKMKILGNMFKRGFGLIPRKMPQAKAYPQ